MSNPWSQAYEELRKPYLEGKMAKKDYDGDGKIESGTDEYKGSVDKAIKKSMGKKEVKEHHQKDSDGNVIPHGDGTPSSVEEENIDELSKTTTANYLYQAKVDKDYVHSGKMGKWAKARDKGLKRAEKKLGSKVSKKVSDDARTDSQSMRRDIDNSRYPRKYKITRGGVKEDTEQLDELSKKTLTSYGHKAIDDRAHFQKAKKVVGDSPYIDKKIDKRNKGINLAIKKVSKKNEEVEQIDELSGKTLDSYIKKASKDINKPDKKSYGKGNKIDRHKSMLKAVAKRDKKELYGEDVEQIDELSKKTLGGYVKKASKEARGNMVATQHGSGIPKKAKDIKLKQVNKRMKGIEKAGEKLAKEEVVDEMITLTKGDFASRNVAGSAYSTAAKKKFDPKIYKAGGGLGSNFLPLVNSNEPEGNPIEEKDTSAMKKYLDAKAKRLTKEREAQKPEYRNNPAFGDPSHHSNRKNRKEAFSDWRSEFIWEDGDSVKKI